VRAARPRVGAVRCSRCRIGVAWGVDGEQCRAGSPVRSYRLAAQRTGVPAADPGPGPALRVAELPHLRQPAKRGGLPRSRSRSPGTIDLCRAQAGGWRSDRGAARLACGTPTDQRRDVLVAPCGLARGFGGAPVSLGFEGRGGTRPRNHADWRGWIRCATGGSRSNVAARYRAYRGRPSWSVRASVWRTVCANARSASSARFLAEVRGGAGRRPGRVVPRSTMQAGSCRGPAGWCRGWWRPSVSHAPPPSPRARSQNAAHSHCDSRVVRKERCLVC
jgi:hypothetical protein